MAFTASTSWFEPFEACFIFVYSQSDGQMQSLFWQDDKTRWQGNETHWQDGRTRWQLTKHDGQMKEHSCK